MGWGCSALKLQPALPSSLAVSRRRLQFESFAARADVAVESPASTCKIDQAKKIIAAVMLDMLLLGKVRTMSIYLPSFFQIDGLILGGKFQWRRQSFLSDLLSIKDAIYSLGLGPMPDLEAARVLGREDQQQAMFNPAVMAYVGMSENFGQHRFIQHMLGLFKVSTAVLLYESGMRFSLA